MTENHVKLILDDIDSIVHDFITMKIESMSSNIEYTSITKMDIR